MSPEAAARAPSDPLSAAFIARWSHVGAAERANYALFLTELCDVLGVPRPDPAADLARRFSRASATDVAGILDALVTLGRARRGDTPGTYVR